jgi:flagellar hook-basal body complex protein FliE
MPDPVISAIARSAEFRIEPLVGESRPAAQPTDAAGFGKALGNAVGELVKSQQVADQQSQALALGQTSDIAAVAMEVERASLSMQLAVQVRNKAVDAYHEIFRMQV